MAAEAAAVTLMGGHDHPLRFDVAARVRQHMIQFSRKSWLSLNLSFTGTVLANTSFTLVGNDADSPKVWER
jgi:hypothetical protein